MASKTSTSERGRLSPPGPAIRLFVLGEFRAERLGVTVPSAAWQGRKTRSLIKLLCLKRPHQMHKEQIQDTLWPEMDPDSADAAFRKSLHYARRALDPDGHHSPLWLGQGVVSLDPETVSVDLERFEVAAEAALQAGDLRQIGEAAQLWTGEPLPGDLYEEWTHAARRRSVGLYLRLVREGNQVALTAGQARIAEDLLEAGLAVQPEAEDLHRSLMQLLAQSGRRTEALAQFERCRQALEQHVEVEPSTETLELYEDIRRVSPAISQPARRLAAEPHVPLPVRQHPDRFGRVITEPFIGRSRALQILRGAWESAGSPHHPRSVAVFGEAGVGKSRLVAEVARHVDAAGGVVLWGASYELEGQTAYGPFVNALEGYLGALNDGEQEQVSHEYPELAHLLPSLGRWSRPVLPPDVDRPALFDAVARFLTDLGSSVSTPTLGRRVLVVVDDIHSADQASLALFHYLCRLDGDRPWLLVCTLRDEAGPAGRASRALERALIQGGSCHEVALMRFSEDSCRQLVCSRLPGGVDEGVQDLIFRHSLGNPLFAEQIIAAMVERRHILMVGGIWTLSTAAHTDPIWPDALDGLPGGVPIGVRDLAQERLDRLSAAGRISLGIASVVGRRFTFELLLSATSGFVGGRVPERDLLEALESAVELMLIEEGESGYEFRHPLIAAAVHDTLSNPRKALFHKAVAAAMEKQQPEMVEALAFHFKSAGSVDEAAHYLELAADRAANTFANELAESRYRDLLELLDSDQSRTPLVAKLAARVKVKLARLLNRIGSYQESVSILEEVVASLRPFGPSDDLLTALAELGRVLYETGRRPEAVCLLERELLSRRVEAVSRGEALIRLVYAELLSAGGRYDAANRFATEAAQLATELGDLQLAAEAELAHAKTASLLHGIDEGRRVTEAVLPLVLGHAGLEALDRAHQALSYSYKSLGNLGEMYRHAEESLATARRVGDRGQIAVHTAHLGQACLLSGKLGQARELLETASTLLDQITSVAVVADVLVCRGQLETLTGDWEAAHASLTAVTQLYFDRGAPLDLARMAAYWLSEHDLWEGRSADAIRRFEGLVPGPADSVQVSVDLDERLIMSQLAVAYSELIYSSSGLEPPFDLIAASEDCVEHLRGAQATMYLPAPLRSLGIILSNRGLPADGMEKICEALDLNRRIGYRWGEISDLRALAKVQMRAGERSDADLSIAQCSTIAQELGALGLVPHLEASVTAAG